MVCTLLQDACTPGWLLYKLPGQYTLYTAQYAVGSFASPLLPHTQPLSACVGQQCPARPLGRWLPARAVYTTRITKWCTCMHLVKEGKCAGYRGSVFTPMGLLYMLCACMCTCARADVCVLPVVHVCVCACVGVLTRSGAGVHTVACMAACECACLAVTLLVSAVVQTVCMK